MFLKQIFNFFLFFIVVTFSAFSEISIRTSVNKLNSETLFVSFDFKVNSGEHLTAPIGKGKSLSPSISFENAEILNVYWPEKVDIYDNDGNQTGYFGYDKNFALIYSIKVNDITKPIKYDAFYVACGNACVPFQESGELKLNGLLFEDEIQKVTGVNEMGISNLLLMMIFGILGGIILNCMPCVFPVISMKIFSLIKSSGSSIKTIRKQGISHSIGTISTFLTLGILLLILRNSTPEIGWGFFMQDPRFVFILLVIFVLCSLHFFGLFSFNIPNIKLPVKNTYISSFLGGVLGAIASSVCVGPFAGVAIGSALLYGNFIQSCCIFSSIGIGVASPFLIISFFPKLIKMLPKPGKWLAIFKEFMGFAMLLSSVWIVWILINQVEKIKVIYALVSIILLAMFLWMLSHSKNSRIFKGISICGLLVTSVSGILTMNESQYNNDEENIIWNDYSDQVFDDSELTKSPILLNFTASWCMNCQLNQRVFNDKEIVDIFKSKKINAIKCDWTNRDKKIYELLKKYGSISVPFYVYYPGNMGGYKILPNILTKSNLKKILND